MKKNTISKKISICIIGMGYVGLPLANSLSNHFNVTGFDIDKIKIKSLQNNVDQNQEIKKINKKIKFTSNVSNFLNCNVFIICLPTPVSKKKLPDLRILKKCYKNLSNYLKDDDTVILESTVSPGTTEFLSKKYFLKKINIGYSPERINPGDKINTIDKITKIISSNNKKTLKIMKKIYGKINNNNIFEAKDIKTAEAAKIIENTQRDLNIGFINEITKIFNKDNISIHNVLEAANTKWNFLNFSPGLVGGHCIGVDPYYLANYSKKNNFLPKVILSARETNEKMVNFYLKKINTILKKISSKDKVLFLGVTFKENVNDLRNSKYFDLLKKISKNRKCYYYDPLVKLKSYKNLIKYEIKKKMHFKVIILAVNHIQITEILKKNLDMILKKTGIIIDLNKKYEINNNNYTYITL